MFHSHRLKAVVYLNHLSSTPKSHHLLHSLNPFSTTSDSFTLSYFTNNCGLSPQDALKASKRLRLTFTTPEKPNSVIAFFKTHGFSIPQIQSIILKNPQLILSNPTKTILPKFQFLASKGASPSDIVAAVTRSSRFLRVSLEKHIIPAFQLVTPQSLKDSLITQMGFKDRRIGPDICRLASEYISKYEGFEDDIYAYFENEPDADSLYVKLVEEFERCILSYFGFHWNHCDILISQVLSSDISEPKKKLKNIVMAATRDQRFERVAKSLKVASVFNTLVEEMKAMGIAVNDDSQCTHSDRSPVLLLMGGGMGAGKSTVLKDILKEPFWAGASGNAVVIEADAFKESDVIYRALRSTGHHDMIRTAELVR
ncbi:hypothetical protein RYX36_013051 [Vicia faba]